MGRRKHTRIACMAVFICILIPAIYIASQLEPQTATEEFLPSEHPFQRFVSAQSQFSASNEDDTVKVQFVWGFEPTPLDTSGVNLLRNPDYKGSLNLADRFALDEAAQVALIEDCEVLRASVHTRVTVDTSTGTNNVTKIVNCFIEGFRAWTVFKGESFPVPKAKASSALHLWLSGRGDEQGMPPLANPAQYKRELAFKLVGGEHKLAWCKMCAESLLASRVVLPATQVRKYYEDWESVLSQINLNTPDTLGHAFQTAGVESGRRNKWVFMALQETYVRMAVQGVIVGLVLAFLVLLISTWNLLVSGLCILSITGALTCVLACVVALGWQLGSNEALGMMILTGFAVDYVVHLAHAYMASKSATRLERVHDALRDMGISVFWGMLTSVVAAFTLATCQLQNLSKFGTFFLLTIMWAYCWAILFLMPLLASVGPEPPRSPEIQSFVGGDEGHTIEMTHSSAAA